MTQSRDSNRPEHDEQEAEVQDGQVSESSDLGEAGLVGDADSTDKSTGSAPHQAAQPDNPEGAAE